MSDYIPSNAEAVKELRWKKFPVLNDGFVCLVDVMGDDSSIVQAARCSYGAGTKKVSDDEGLIRYLMRHFHSSPSEMCELKFLVRVPMDCWRQWIRHRTACLSGKQELYFDLPGGIKRRGNQLYKKTVKDIYKAFQPTKNKNPLQQRNPHHKRDRIQQMMLRCVNETTNEITYTNIVDIWQTGIKPVYRLTLETGYSCIMSKDHLCLTNAGWLKLEDAISLLPDSENKEIISPTDILFGSIVPSPHNQIPQIQNKINEETEIWKPIPSWQDYYEVSTQGRIRRIIGGKGSRSFGRCKQTTVSRGGRLVVSLNKPGKQCVHLVHRLMALAFYGKQPSPLHEVCHRDGNALNNVIENIYWGTSQENKLDSIRHNCLHKLKFEFCKVAKITYVGQEMTYDLEVSDPHHNFCAGGLIVHNSVNEYSTRYSEAIDSQQVTDPEEWRSQSKTNKQGSAEFLPVGDSLIGSEIKLGGNTLSNAEENFHVIAKQLYQERLDAGVAREQARKDLPLSTYTEAYWKIDLHNLFHFLRLRMDSHAQLEIRSYANIIGYEIVSKLFPLSWKAFLDYRLNSMTLSSLEVKFLGYLAAAGFVQTYTKEILEKLNTEQNFGLSKREIDEFLTKLNRMKM